MHVCARSERRESQGKHLREEKVSEERRYQKKRVQLKQWLWLLLTPSLFSSLFSLFKSLLHSPLKKQVSNDRSNPRTISFHLNFFPEWSLSFSGFGRKFTRSINGIYVWRFFHHQKLLSSNFHQRFHHYSSLINANYH